MRSPCRKPECEHKSKTWCASHCKQLKAYQEWLSKQEQSPLKAVDIHSEYTIGE